MQGFLLTASYLFNYTGKLEPVFRGYNIDCHPALEEHFPRIEDYSVPNIFNAGHDEFIFEINGHYVCIRLLNMLRLRTGKVMNLDAETPDAQVNQYAFQLRVEVKLAANIGHLL